MNMHRVQGIIRVYTNLKHILTQVATVMKTKPEQNEEWVLLERWEASISTNNGARRIVHADTFQPTTTLRFFDNSCVGHELSVEEWKQFARHLKPLINKELDAECEVSLYCDI